MTDSLDLDALALGPPSRLPTFDLADDGVVIDLTVDPPVVTYNSRRLPLIEVAPSRRQRITVRAFDLIASSVLVLLLLPVFALLWLTVRFTSAGPAVYFAQRMGYDGQAFRAYKFRSMVEHADELLELHLLGNDAARAEYTEFHKLRDDPRVTSVGRFLRALSIDELPQLFNVLRGNMSLVGPRPLLLAECDQFGPTVPTVLRVKPGLTGLWQVSGRSHLTLNDRIMLDVEYATNRSLRGDVVICLRTVWHLVTPGRRGAY